MNTSIKQFSGSNYPLFSVLIANYNNGRYIEEALQSVLQQSYQNWEVVIVDDASTDNSAEVLKKYETDTRIKVFKNDKNEGCGFTKRRCAELALGEICGFLDPDDALTVEALGTSVNEHIRHPDCSFTYSRMILCDENLKNVRESFYAEPIPAGKTYLHLPCGKVAHFVCFKRKLYLQTAGIDPSFIRAVDQDLYYKLEEQGPVVFIDKALYNYRTHRGGISTFENTDKAFAWSILARVEACRRRNISVEEILPSILKSTQTIAVFYEKSKDYRLGKALLKPIRQLKKILRR